MPLKPEIRGLYLMASRCFESGQYEAALQYFTLALRKYVRSKAHGRHRPMVLILTLNSCAVLCRMRQFADAFSLLNAVCLCYISDPEYFLQIVPNQLIPMILKIIVLTYLHAGNTQETTELAVKYLQLLRIYYHEPFFATYLPAEEAVFLFLAEASLNFSSCSAQESLIAFHSAYRLLKMGPPTATNPKIASLLLDFATKSMEGVCSLSKSELEITRTLMSPLDFVCFLNIIGASNIVAGRTLIAVEALEKALNLLNSDQIGTIVTKLAQHRHLRIYLESCISNNLSVVYHMLDVRRNYRHHWESLSSHATALMEQIETNNRVPAIFWAIRYFAIFNLAAHSSLLGDYKTARRNFSVIYNEETSKLIEKCGKLFVPDLHFELLEVLAMLLAALGNSDESGRTFLLCFEQVSEAADEIQDPVAKQNYLVANYARILNKLDRCHPPSKKNSREIEQIRRLVSVAPVANRIAQSSISTQNYDIERNRPSSIGLEKRAERTAPSIDAQNSPARDAELVIREFKNALHIDECLLVKKKRKKRRTLMQRVFAVMPGGRNLLLKASPYYSSDLNLHHCQMKRAVSHSSSSLSDHRLHLPSS